MNYFRTLFSCIIAMMILSCEEEVTPPQVENAEDKLVVNGLIAPSFDEINVQVSLSKSAFGVIDYDNSDIITDAQVTITNGVTERTLDYSASIEQYILSTDTYPIEEGVTYRIEVTADGITVFGEATVPRRILELESSKIVDNYKVEVFWKDLSNETNYYRIVADGESELGSEYRDPFFFDGDEFVSDKNRDGQLLSAKGEGYQYGNGYDRVNLRIISCEENYFDYYEILVNYEGEDPFADPVRLPSNIEGGLGIFAAVQISEFTIER